MFYVTYAGLSNLVFGLFLLVIMLAFMYYIYLQRKVSGKILAEFWSSTGERTYVLVNKKREMLIDQCGEEIIAESVDEKGVVIPAHYRDETVKEGESPRVVDMGVTQIVVEVEVPKQHLKFYPELKQCGYYTRRDCVDKIRYPVGSPIPIHVDAYVCAWEMGSSEPIDPRELHMKLPITSSAGFASGVREHDILMQAGMMVESMQNFMNESAQKIASFAKGTVSKNTVLIGFCVVGGFALVGIGVSVVTLAKLSSLGG